MRLAYPAEPRIDLRLEVIGQSFYPKRMAPLTTVRKGVDDRGAEPADLDMTGIDRLPSR